MKNCTSKKLIVAMGSNVAQTAVGMLFLEMRASFIMTILMFK